MGTHDLVASVKATGCGIISLIIHKHLRTSHTPAQHTSAYVSIRQHTSVQGSALSQRFCCDRVCETACQVSALSRVSILEHT